MKKSTLIALGVFVVLAVAVVASMRRAPERGISRISFMGLDKDKIDGLETAGANVAKLKKEGELWKLEDGKEADGPAVTRALETLAKMQSSDLVTKSSDRFAELEVDDVKGTKVRAYAGGKEVASFVLGKAGSGGSHVRVGDEVFLVKGVYSSVFGKQASAWVERRIFKKTAADATALEVRLQGQAPYALVKNGTAWELKEKDKVPAGFRFDPALASSLAGSVAGLRAKDILDQKPGVEVSKLEAGDVFVVTFKGEKEGAPDVTATLRLGAAKEDDKSVYGAVDGKDLAFTIADGTAKSLRKSLLDLRDLSMASFDVTKAKELVVSDGKNRTAFTKKDGAWTLASTNEKKPADFELDPAAVERRVNQLNTAKAAKIVDSPSGNTGLGAPSARVSVKLEDGKSVEIVFGATTKQDDRELVYAKGTTHKEVFLATSWSKSSLAGGLGTFKKQEMPQGGGMPNIDPKSLENLPPDVRASLMRQLEQKKREQELMKQIQQQATK